MNKTSWLIIAALCGALVSLRTERRKRTLIQKFTFVFCGFVFSFFVTPLIVSIWHLKEVGAISAIGFLFAMGWQSIYARFIRGVEDAQLPFERERDQTLEILEKVERLREQETKRGNREGESE